MTTDERSPLDRALSKVHPRRVVLAALALGGAAAAIAPAADLAAKKKKKKKVWTYRAQFGSEGTGDTNLNYPADVAVSADGRTAWVADSENHRISVWTRPTSTSTEWIHSINFGSGPGIGDANFNFPWGVTVSVDGRTIWVPDIENHRISVWTRPSDISTEWSHSINFGSAGTGNANFIYPYGVAVSVDGRTVWVADAFNDRISVWTRTTNTSTEWSPSTTFGSGPGIGGDNFNGPSGVAVSADERTAWVADSGNHRISVWTRPTSISTDWSHSITFGSEGTGNTNFMTPEGVTVSADGRTVWVADRLNHRVSVWSRPTNSSTVWSPSTTYGSEGYGDANFIYPTALAVSADGRTVWVADYYNHRISVWTYS